MITIEDDEVVDPATATVSEAVKPEDNDHIKVESVSSRDNRSE